MIRLLLLASLAAAFLACGPKPRPIPDAGEDAGVDAGVDAGRPRGDEPPNGWSNAVPLDPDAGLSSRLGVSAASAADQFNHPLIAAIYDDPNGDSLKADTRVVFTRWNGTDKAFEPLKTVEVVGDVDLSPPHRQVSVARDAASGRIGVAYTKDDGTIRYAWSDDEGESFSLSTVSNNPLLLPVSNPQLALKDGVVHLAYAQGDTVVYRRRQGTAAYVDEAAPLLGGATATVHGPLSLGLDGQGNAGVAYFVAQAGGAAQLQFWRPGTTTAAVIATSGTVDVTTLADRRPSVTLTFAGELPRVAFHLRNQEPLPSVDDTTELWYAAASDAAGATWGTPAPIGRNGDATRFHSTRWYQGLTADPSGGAVLAAFFGASGSAGVQCQGPKLARSATGTNFQTCAPVATPFSFAGEWLSMWSHKPNKQTLVFHSDSRFNPTVKAGLVLWREP